MKKVLFSLVMAWLSLGYIVAEEKVKETDKKWEIKDNRSPTYEPQVSLYNGILYISSDGQINNLSICMQSMTGEMVMEQTDITLLPGQPYLINISDLPSDEYLLFLQSGSNYAIYSVTK